LIQSLTLRFLPGVGHWAEQNFPEEVNLVPTAWLSYQPIPGSATVSPRRRIRA
jgi:hypothetical protein